MATWKKVVVEDGAGTIAQAATKLKAGDYGEISVAINGDMTIDSTSIDLSDIDASGAAAGYGLKVNQSEDGLLWGSVASSIANLGDVTLDNNTAGELIVATAADAWENKTLEQANIMRSNNATASRVIVSDENGDIGESSITTGELGYLNDASSNIQSQLNDKQTKDDELTTLSGMTATQATGLVGSSGQAAFHSMAVGGSNTFANNNIVGIYGETSISADLKVKGGGVTKFHVNTDGDIDAEGDLDVLGDVTIEGTLTNSNSTDLSTENLTFTLNSDAASSANAALIVDVNATNDAHNPRIAWQPGSGNGVLSAGWIMQGDVHSDQTNDEDMGNQQYIQGVYLNGTSPGNGDQPHSQGAFCFTTDNQELYICTDTTTNATP